LTVVGDGMEAEVVCGLLRASGINCSQRPREVIVAASDLETARETLDAGSAA
jgi:hypothetical protein